MAHLAPPLFPASPAADVVRSGMREIFALDILRDHIQKATEVILGPQAATRHLEKINTVSDTLYYSVTTIAGSQTMGEEYCDIIQFSERTGSFPNLFRRTLSVGMHILGQRVISVILRMATAGASSSKSIINLAVPATRISDRIGRWKQLHMGIFYLQGRFYHISKRILGISYLSTSPPAETESPFKLLGILIFIQLAVRAWIASKVWYKERILLADHALENASFAKAGGSQGMLNDVDDEEDEEEAEGPNCAMCLNPCKTATATPCGHIFCWQCICDWCNTKSLCPVCRQPATHQQLWIVDL